MAWSSSPFPVDTRPERRPQGTRGAVEIPVRGARRPRRRGRRRLSGSPAADRAQGVREGLPLGTADPLGVSRSGVARPGDREELDAETRGLLPRMFVPRSGPGRPDLLRRSQSLERNGTVARLFSEGNETLREV